MKSKDLRKTFYVLRFKYSHGCYRFQNLKNGTYKVRVKSCTGGGTKTVVISGGKKVNGKDLTCK